MCTRWSCTSVKVLQANWCLKYLCSGAEMHFVEDRTGRSIVSLEYRSDCAHVIQVGRNAMSKARTHQYGFKMALHGGLHATGS